MREEIKKWLADALPKLGEAFPEQAIQRTFTDDDVAKKHGKKQGTQKGYDTTGIGYQWIADRLNSVLGIEGWRASIVSQHVAERETRNNKLMYEVTALVRIEILWQEASGPIVVTYRECHGGHASLKLDDANKGAFTNGMKKTAALLGCGAYVYRDEIDDDNQPLPEAPGQASKRNGSSGAPRANTPPANKPPEEKPANKPIEKTGADAKVDEAAKIIARMGELVETLGKERCDGITKHLRPMKSLDTRRKALALLEEAAKSAGADASPELIDQLAQRADMSAEDLDAWSVELYGRPVAKLDAGFRANLAGRLEEAVAKLEAQLAEPGSDG